MVGVTIGNDIHLAVTTSSQSRWRTGHAGVIGVHGQLQAGIVQRLDEQGQVSPPVAGHDRVGARLLDFGHIRGKVFDLSDGVQIFARNLHIRTFARNAFLEITRDLLTV